MEQELLTLPEYLNSPPVFSGVRVTRLVLYVPYFTDNRSMGTIGRIAAFRLNFWGNTKIGRSIP